MFTAQTYTYKVAENCPIQADVYQPSGAGPHPAILWIHGGALILGSRGALSPAQAATYLNAGYAIVAIDYRLAPETHLEQIILDLRDAYLWLREQGPVLLNIDPERIAAVGHSAGGYLALMLGYCVTPRPRAIVSFYGYGDIVSPWYTRPSPYYCQQPLVSQMDADRTVGITPLTSDPFAERFPYYLRCRQQGTWPWAVSGHDPEQDPAWFKPYCPARNITPHYPPTLLIHGDQDTDVPQEQSLLLAQEMERCGVEHELVVLANRGHGFDGEGDGMQDPVIAGVFERVLAFLNKHGMR
jgi:acetyl esterase/lipase